MKFTEYKDSIGKPCPKCGNNLLTEKEYKDCVRMYIRIAQVENFIKIMKWFNPLNYFRFIFGVQRKKYTLKKDYLNRPLYDKS